MRYRNITCHQDDEKEVSQEFCIKNRGRLDDLQTESTCRVPCPGDCVISRWSRWGECNRKCDKPDEGMYTSFANSVNKMPR
jgi:hypothetical protein